MAAGMWGFGGACVGWFPFCMCVELGFDDGGNGEGDSALMWVRGVGFRVMCV